MKMKILRAGPQTSVQDTGRFGYREMGVSPGGVLDPMAARVANLLVGNAEDAAVLEIALGQARFSFEDERLLAWCGGDFEVRAGGDAFPAGHVCIVRPGDEVVVGAAQVGCRLWLAVSGGIDVPVVLGSRSTDLRAGFGGFSGRRLRDGDQLSLGQITAASRSRMAALPGRRCSSWSASSAWARPEKRFPVLHFVRGVDWNRFEKESQDAIHQQVFLVGPESNRMGVRLRGPELKRREAEELASQAVAQGALQVPASGDPILLLGDCGSIGGYPKIAHIITADLAVAAQLRTGDQLRFAETTIEEAHRLLAEQEGDLVLFRVGLEALRDT